jgi:branched-chain amino acid transport system ATP-binding protein
MSEPVLRTHGLTLAFGALRVADGIDFSILPGARHALIGPNGAGKTTLLNLITGRLAPTAGSVELLATDITRLSEHARVQRGIGRTFQVNQLFLGLSVLENVALAVAERSGIGARMWRPFGTESAVLQEATDLLARVHLQDEAGRLVHELSYGRQRLLEIALGLALRPKLLLLDEPAAGVPAAEAQEVLATIEALPRDIAVLIVEHDMDIVFRFASRITVLHHGRIAADGPPDAIARDPFVTEIYFGTRGSGHG